MIVKRIPAKPMGGYVVDARARHARQLVSYLLLPEKKGSLPRLSDRVFQGEEAPARHGGRTLASPRGQKFEC